MESGTLNGRTTIRLMLFSGGHSIIFWIFQQEILGNGGIFVFGRQEGKMAEPEQ